MSVSVSQIGIDRSLDRSIDQSRFPGQSLDQSICVYRCLYKEQHPLKRALTFTVRSSARSTSSLFSSHPHDLSRAYTTCPQRCATSLIFCDHAERIAADFRKLRLVSSRSRLQTRNVGLAGEFTMLDVRTKNNEREIVQRNTTKRAKKVERKVEDTDDRAGFLERS